MRQEELRREEIARRKEEIRNRMQQEPELTENSEDLIKILLKLPNGTRLERRFLKSQSLQVRNVRFSFLKVELRVKVTSCWFMPLFQR